MIDTRSIIKILSRFCSAFILLLAFSSQSQSGNRTSNLHIQARVLPRLSFRVLDQPAILRIKKRDLKKEKPEKPSHLNGRTVISVETNNSIGYVLLVQALDNRLFSSIKVTLKETGQIFTLRPGGQIEIHIPNRGKDPDVNKLNFDFNLLPGTATGNYPWPIAVTARLL